MLSRVGVGVVDVGIFGTICVGVGILGGINVGVYWCWNCLHYR